MINGVQNITLGRYLPGDSIIHRLEPRLKFSLVISLMIITSLTRFYYLFVLIGVFAVVLGLLSKIPFLTLIKGLRPFLFLFLFTFLFHSFLTPGGDVYISFIGSTGITYEGLQQGAIINLRLFLLIYLSSILTLTTSPQKMVYAIEWFLSPLKLCGFPVKKFSMMILISLKFIPIIFQEINKAVSFHKNKHRKYGKWNLYLRVKEATSLISPIVINSVRRANELAEAIDNYGFDVIEKL